MATPNLPARLTEVVGEDFRNDVLQSRSGAGASSQRTAHFHGHGGGAEASKEELDRYLREVDRQLRPYLRRGVGPLVLAAVEAVAVRFRGVSDYPWLAKEAVIGNPDRLSVHQLHQSAWPLARVEIEREADEAVGRYRELVSGPRASADLSDILVAAHEGRVETLLVAEGAEAWGRFTTSPPALERADGPSDGADDLVDLAVLACLRHGGSAYQVAARRRTGWPRSGCDPALLRAGGALGCRMSR